MAAFFTEKKIEQEKTFFHFFFIFSSFVFHRLLFESIIILVCTIHNFLFKFTFRKYWSCLKNKKGEK